MELVPDQDGPWVDESAQPEPKGGWVLKAVPKHACILPRIDNQTFVGSVWQCGECGQHYRVADAAGEKKFRKMSAVVAEKKLSNPPRGFQRAEG